MLATKRHDLVYCIEDVEKNFYRKWTMVMPAGRVCVFYGQTHPGKVTIYGVFDTPAGDTHQCHRQVRADIVRIFEPELLLANVSELAQRLDE